MNHYAVIPSGFRPVELRNLVTQLVMDNVQVVIIDTGYESIKIAHPQVRVIQDHRAPKNIQRWWNVGLRAVYDTQLLSDDEFIVAIINDDVIVPPGFVQTLGQCMIEQNASAACPEPGLKTAYWNVVSATTKDINHGIRMAGWAFALRGIHGLQADERFGWWYGDNDLDWQARLMGGVTFVGGAWDGLQHLYPDQTTVGELAEQAGRDRETFIQKWGRAPW